MPRGGPRPGAGRPREEFQGREVYVALTPQMWSRLERDLERLWPYLGPRYRYRSRILGLLLVEGVQALKSRYRRER